jgi:hypothetical protein
MKLTLEQQTQLRQDREMANFEAGRPTAFSTTHLLGGTLSPRQRAVYDIQKYRRKGLPTCFDMATAVSTLDHLNGMSPSERSSYLSKLSTKPKRRAMGARCREL